jgi:hypothetical protein
MRHLGDAPRWRGRRDGPARLCDTATLLARDSRAQGAKDVEDDTKYKPHSWQRGARCGQGSAQQAAGRLWATSLKR